MTVAFNIPEATFWQLEVCNACRYCEGYCAVFPALEKRRRFTPGDVVYLAKLYGHRSVPAPSRIGGRLPAYCTAVGKVLLAYDSGAAEQTLAAPLKAFAPGTIVDPRALASRLVLAVGFFIMLSFYQYKGRGDSPDHWLLHWAFITYAVALFTDFLDGYLARKWKIESGFGRIVDP